jgi:hypothetical protein
MKDMLMIEEMEEIANPSWAALAAGVGAGLVVGIIVIAVVGCGGC